MTAIDRMERLKKMTGLSEQIIKQVLRAEAEVAALSLAETGKAVLTGRAILTAERGVKWNGVETKAKVNMKAKASSSLATRVYDLLIGEDEDDSDAITELASEIIDIKISKDAKQILELK